MLENRYQVERSQNTAFPSDIEGLFLELKFKKIKLLSWGIYHLPSQHGQYFFNSSEKT